MTPLIEVLQKRYDRSVTEERRTYHEFIIWLNDLENALLVQEIDAAFKERDSE